MVTNHTCVFESIQISRGKYVFGALLTVRKLLAWYLMYALKKSNKILKIFVNKNNNANLKALLL